MKHPFISSTLCSPEGLLSNLCDCAAQQRAKPHQLFMPLHAHQLPCARCSTRCPPNCTQQRQGDVLLQKHGHSDPLNSPEAILHNNGRCIMRNLVSACLQRRQCVSKICSNHQDASECVTLSCKDTHGCSCHPGGKIHKLSELGLLKSSEGARHMAGSVRG